MKIKKGLKYVCIKDVVMNKEFKDIAYKKGFIYLSEIDECITNYNFNVNHCWPKGTRPERFFIKLK